MQNKPKGMLIAIEGIDGCGKSTLARNLFQELQKRNAPAHLTKEPGDSQLGSLLRTIVQKQNVPVCPKAEFLLFAADRAQHFEELIIPKLNQGSIIISDRMADSSIVYQGYGRGLDTEMIMSVNRWVMQNIKPDLVLYLRIAPETAFARLQHSRAELTAFEAEQTFMKKVLEGFEELYKNREDVIILDGTEKPGKLAELAVEAVMKLNSELK